VELTRYEGAAPAGAAAYAFDRDAGRMEARTSDPDASLRFWTESLPFRVGDDGLLALTAPLPAWRLEVRLVPAPEGGRRTTVDADGYVLVTLLSTDIAGDLARLEASGLVLRSTPSWRETIGDRQAHVALVEGPGGELVELLEAPRRGGRAGERS